MDSTGKGIGAGFIASLAVWAVIYAKILMGLMPQFAPAQLLTLTVHALGGPMDPVAGWIAHFVIGAALWGGLFGAFNHRVPGRTERAKGLWFGVFAWLMMMTVAMPLAGVGFFALSVGWGAPAVWLALHLLFGYVLGSTYASLLHVRASQEIYHRESRA